MLSTRDAKNAPGGWDPKNRGLLAIEMELEPSDGTGTGRMGVCGQWGCVYVYMDVGTYLYMRMWVRFGTPPIWQFR